MHRYSSARKVEWHLCIFRTPCFYAFELFELAKDVAEMIKWLTEAR